MLFYKWYSNKPKWFTSLEFNLKEKKKKQAFTYEQDLQIFKRLCFKTNSNDLMDHSTFGRNSKNLPFCDLTELNITYYSKGKNNLYQVNLNNVQLQNSNWYTLLKQTFQ